ncbi:putative pectate lyase 5 [Iris pallida]|uniref:Pectate lyase n=1 Tax=Iris pallida TaxID=29817 RepID=A0AAX6IF54_IRIPA|nr:putative pectate lyase 5 [Iris pallida]
MSILLFFTHILLLHFTSTSASAATSLNSTSPEVVVEHLQAQLHHSRSRFLLQQQQSSSSSGGCLTGNPIDDCWRCSSSSSDRRALAGCGVGFGRNAVGGRDGQIYVVTDSSDRDPVNPSPGTLRHAAIQDVPLWITFASSMTIRLSQELLVNNFKTLDGRGADVHIAGGGCLTLQYVSNVILHNLNIHHCVPTGDADVRSSPTHSGHRSMADGDGISLYSARDVWIDHCSLWRCADGLVDAIMGSTGITVSNSYFADHDEVMLLGHSDDYLPDSGMRVTIAFNRFGPGLVQRMPRCRRGYVHVVNNDYTGWGMYAIGGSGGPTINSQGNRYAAPSDPNSKEVTKRETEEGWKDWNWRTEGDVMVNGAFFVPSGEGLQAKYSMAESVQPKAEAMIDQLTMNAGVFGGGASSRSSSSSSSGGVGGGGTSNYEGSATGGGGGGGESDDGGNGNGYYGKMIFGSGATPSIRRRSFRSLTLFVALLWLTLFSS